MRFVVTLLGLVILPVSASAHHNPNVHFDRNEVVEISGVLTELKWQNPHVQLRITTLDEDGQEVVWLADEDSHNALARRGVTRDQYRIGENIRVAGFRGRRSPTAIYVTNTLLADGRELVSEQSSGPRWNTDLVASEEFDQASKLENVSAVSSGIFRVWSIDFAGNSADGLSRALWNDSYPLTAQARATQANWDPNDDNPFIHCQNAMPAIMDSASPMEIILEDGDILIRMEEQDVVRRISMGAGPTERVSSPYGHSVGRWEGESLVVTTTDIDWPWFDQAGIPQSAALRLIERFSLSADNHYLNYSVVATDPTIFTEPVVLEKRWIWVPGEEVKSYECIWERDDL